MFFSYKQLLKGEVFIPRQPPETIGEVYRIKLDELHAHPENPYGIRDDPAMQELIESVKQFGVLVPAIARPKESGGYELIAGHRRQKASQLAGLDSMPVVVMNLDDSVCYQIYLKSKQNVQTRQRNGLIRKPERR